MPKQEHQSPLDTAPSLSVGVSGGIELWPGGSFTAVYRLRQTDLDSLAAVVSGTYTKTIWTVPTNLQPLFIKRAYITAQLTVSPSSNVFDGAITLRTAEPASFFIIDNYTPFGTGPFIFIDGNADGKAEEGIVVSSLASGSTLIARGTSNTEPRLTSSNVIELLIARGSAVAPSITGRFNIFLDCVALPIDL